MDTTTTIAPDITHRADVYNRVLDISATIRDVTYKLSDKTLERVNWKLATVNKSLFSISCSTGIPRYFLDTCITEFRNACDTVMSWLKQQLKWFAWRLEEWEKPILWELWGYLSELKEKEGFPSQYDHLFH